jgi:hypothetical protein
MNVVNKNMNPPIRDDDEKLLVVVAVAARLVVFVRFTNDG